MKKRIEFDPDDLDPQEKIRREEFGGNSRNYDKASGKSRGRDRQRQNRRSGPKVVAVTALAMEVGERWMSRAADHDREPPFNAAWVGNEIHAKMSADPEFGRYAEAGMHDQVRRWVLKMVEAYWDDYDPDTVEDQRRDFLGEMWEDVRDYAHRSLRAAYLKKHGKRLDPPEYFPRDEQPMRRAIRRADFEGWLERAQEDSPEDREHRPLDSGVSEVLRSAARERSREDG